MELDEACDILENSIPLQRAVYWESFYEFCNHFFIEYYSFETPECLMKYYEALESWKNVYFKWFRWSAKTTIAQMYVMWCIAYKSRRNIMWYSQTIDNAEENLTYISNSFIGDTDQWERFCRVYWNLYYPDTVVKQTQRKIKRIDKFITENYCYVRAMSLWTSPRWKNYTAPDGKFRPDLLIFDDVDTIASCSSKKKIDKNFEFLLNEVLWWTTSNTQILFLWNTIYEDWLVPRFEEHIRNDKNRETIVLPIYDENKKIVWNRFVETDDEAIELNDWIRDVSKRYISLESERRRLWSISFNQNYMLIPYVNWQHVITRDMIKYDENCMNYKFDRIQIWVDPAVSENEWSDEFAICILWFINKRKYVLDTIWLNWKEKDIWKASETVKQTYTRYSAKRVVVETVAYQQVLKNVFKRLWMAVQEYKTIKDKTTRLMEKQIEFEDWNVIFNTTPWNDKLINQLLEFPNWEHDDRIDALLLAMQTKEKKFFISSI
jgi:predicted phage terminase large subunit-like protein